MDFNAENLSATSQFAETCTWSCGPSLMAAMNAPFLARVFIQSNRAELATMFPDGLQGKVTTRVDFRCAGPQACADGTRNCMLQTHVWIEEIDTDEALQAEMDDDIT